MPLLCNCHLPVLLPPLTYLRLQHLLQALSELQSWACLGLCPTQIVMHCILPNATLELVQVYLERQGDMQDKSQKGSAPNSSNWEAVARLLSRKHDRIDPQHALDLLPGLVRHVP